MSGSPFRDRRRDPTGNAGTQARTTGGSPAGRLRFGPFTFDPRTGELTRDGAPARLAAQPARVLGVLLRRPGTLVSRESIQEELWGAETFVDFDQGINHCIRRIRAALGDRAGGARYLETVPRKGYRFVAPVDWIDPPAAPPVKSPVLAAARWSGAGILGIVILAALLAFALGSRSSGGAAGSLPRLVVLPFIDLGEQPADARIGHALTEELIARLGRQYSGRLGVIARTSSMRYAEPTRTVAEIRRELDVDYVLEGSIQRSGGTLRVTAQLIRASDEVHLWAGNYDRAAVDLLKVQQDIARKIARALVLNILPPEDRQVPAASTSPEVYELYLRGRTLLGAGRYAEATPVLEGAARADPGFAPVHAALSIAYRVGSDPYPVRMERARDAAERALALDETQAEAHLSLAELRFYYDHDREAARRSFERALAAHPGYAEAHQSFAAYYSVLGRHEEALAEVRAAQALDPLSPSVNGDVGWYYFFARRYDDAIRESLRTLEIAPGDYWANRCLLLSYLQLGRMDAGAAQARGEMEAGDAGARIPDGAAPEEILASYLDWDLERKERAVANAEASPTSLATIHVLRGENDLAIAALERATEIRSGWILPFLAVHPTFDPLRGDPRFTAILERIESRSHIQR
ncbi:MAG: winged helix-turn-helix domain-containing protein [Acidobacteriota bacterium]|jgi:TolB-like protein/DNA-binding winged helix-turn-helix (wHTH) protein/Flp pilus assembly protein TadD